MLQQVRGRANSAESSDIKTAAGGIPYQGCPHSLWVYQTPPALGPKTQTWPPGSSMGQDFTMTSSALGLFLSSPYSPVLPFFIVYTPFCFFLSSLSPPLVHLNVAGCLRVSRDISGTLCPVSGDISGMLCPATSCIAKQASSWTCSACQRLIVLCWRHLWGVLCPLRPCFYSKLDLMTQFL